MTRIGRYSPYGVAVLARLGGRYEPYCALFAVWRDCSGPYRWPLSAVLAASCCAKWLSWPVSVAVMTSIGRYVPYGVAALARVGGRYGPCWALFAVWNGGVGPCRWPLRAVLAVICRMAGLFGPVSLAVMSRIGRYLLCEVAVLARIGGRYEPYWSLFAV